MKKKSIRDPATAPLSTAATKLQVKLGAIPNIEASKRKVSAMQRDVAQLLFAAAQIVSNCSNPLIMEAAKTDARIITIANQLNGLISNSKSDYDRASDELVRCLSSTDVIDINFKLITITEAFLNISMTYQEHVVPLIEQYRVIVQPILSR